MVIYACLKRALQPSPHGRGPAADTALPLWARILSGGLANVLNIGFWYPLNTCLHWQQAELPLGLRHKLGVVDAQPRGGLLATLRALLAEGGVPRLYRGFGYAMLRAGPVAAVIMPCFECVLPLLERTACAAGIG